MARPGRGWRVGPLRPSATPTPEWGLARTLGAHTPRAPCPRGTVAAARDAGARPVPAPARPGPPPPPSIKARAPGPPLRRNFPSRRLRFQVCGTPARVEPEGQLPGGGGGGGGRARRERRRRPGGRGWLGFVSFRLPAAQGFAVSLSRRVPRAAVPVSRVQPAHPRPDAGPTPVTARVRAATRAHSPAAFAEKPAPRHRRGHKPSTHIWDPRTGDSGATPVTPATRLGPPTSSPSLPGGNTCLPPQTTAPAAGAMAADPER